MHWQGRSKLHHFNHEPLEDVTQPPTDLGDLVMAAFDDTCGNLIQITVRPSASATAAIRRSGSLTAR